MNLLSWTPGSAVFWAGLAIMTWAAWVYRHRPELMLKLISPQSRSVGDQAERWLRSRAG